MDIELLLKKDDRQEEEEESDEVTVNADNEKSHFNDRTEKVANIGTETVTTSGGVLSKNNMNRPDKKAGKKTESNKPMVEETIEPYSFVSVGGRRKKKQKARTDIINNVSMEAIEKERKGIINENLLDGMNIPKITDLGAKVIMGKKKADS